MAFHCTKCGGTVESAKDMKRIHRNRQTGFCSECDRAAQRARYHALKAADPDVHRRRQAARPAHVRDKVNKRMLAYAAELRKDPKYMARHHLSRRKLNAKIRRKLRQEKGDSRA